MVAEWVHSDDLASYEQIAEYVEESMHMYNRLSAQMVESISDSEVFPCIDRIILTKLMSDIGNEIVDTDLIEKVGQRRRTSAWFDRYSG